jgi:hypothetical protein
VPLLPSSVTEPAWVEFAALVGVSDRPEFSPDHPWGCHRRRVADRVVFEHVLAALVHGSGYERTAVGCATGPSSASARPCCGPAWTATTR